MKKILDSKLYVPSLIIFIHFVLTIAVVIPNFQAPTQEPTSEERNLLRPVVSTIEKELRRRGVEFNPARIYLTNLKNMNDAVGVTITASQIHLGRWIEIKKSYYMSAPAEIKEALILHEYGHYLGLNHNNTIGISFCPITVMHSYHDMAGCFFKYRKYYYDELAQEVLSL